MLKVHCVGVLLLFGVLLLVWLDMHAFGLREDSPTFLKDKEKEGKGDVFVARAFIYRTPALNLEVGVGVTCMDRVNWTRRRFLATAAATFSLFIHTCLPESSDFS